MSVAALNGLRTMSNSKISASDLPASGNGGSDGIGGGGANARVALGVMQHDVEGIVSGVSHAAATDQYQTDVRPA